MCQLLVDNQSWRELLATGSCKGTVFQPAEAPHTWQDSKNISKVQPSGLTVLVNFTPSLSCAGDENHEEPEMEERQAKWMNHLSGTKNWEPGVCTSRRPHLGCPESLVLPLFSMQPRPKTEMLHGRAETYDNLCRKHFGCLRVVHSNLTSSSRSSLAMRSRHFRDWLILRAKEKSFHCWVMLEQDPNLWDTWGQVILLEGQRETLSFPMFPQRLYPWFSSHSISICVQAWPELLELISFATGHVINI